MTNMSTCPHCGSHKDISSFSCRACDNKTRHRIMVNLEKAVLMFYASGLSCPEIAARFRISHYRIEQILTSAQNRFRVWGRGSVTRWAIKTGLLAP